ncbi:MAG: flagellar export protein FliJ [Planctomycetota bacterium]
MSQFVFRYQSVLKQRIDAERREQKQLARLMHQRNGMVDSLREMQTTISQSKRDAAGGLVGKVDLDAIAGIARYSARCAAQGHGLVRQLAALETQVEQAKSTLLEATKQRKALELLRDRQYEAWRLEQRRMEAKRLDEQTTQAHARRVLAESRICEPSSPRWSSLSSSTR